MPLSGGSTEQAGNASGLVPFCLLQGVFRTMLVGVLTERSRRGLGQELALQLSAAAGQEQQGQHRRLICDPAGRSPHVLYLCSPPGKARLSPCGARGILLCPPSASRSCLCSWQDVRAHTSIPLLGYQVRDLPQGTCHQRFQLVRSGQVLPFVADSEELKQRWMRAMARAAAGIPHPRVEDVDSCGEAE